MAKSEATKDCIFYNGDYHFEMIILPYVNKYINDNKKILIFTEENLEDTIKVLLERVNLKKEDKDRILEINWNNNDEDKLRYLSNLDDKNDMAIYIKGSKEYINKINNQIENLTDDFSVNIVDCYDFDEVKDQMGDIKQKYRDTLKTIKI